MRVAAILALTVLLAGCTSSAWTHNKDASLANGQISEINLDLKDGDKIYWDWQTEDGKQVYFDVHVHRSHVVASVVKLSAASESKDSYTADGDGEYSLFWENQKPQVVKLHYETHGDGEFIGAV